MTSNVLLFTQTALSSPCPTNSEANADFYRWQISIALLSTCAKEWNKSLPIAFKPIPLLNIPSWYTVCELHLSWSLTLQITFFSKIIYQVFIWKYKREGVTPIVRSCVRQPRCVLQYNVSYEMDIAICDHNIITCVNTYDREGGQESYIYFLVP